MTDFYEEFMNDINTMKDIKMNSEPKDKLIYFAISDFGNVTKELLQVSKAMDQYALTYGKPDFILGLGDNFYWDGVTDVNDPKFTRVWKNTFLRYPSLRVPWRMVLGNHDYYTNPQAQIEYHYSPVHNQDHYWYMPSKSYSFSYDLWSADHSHIESVSFFALDSNGADMEIGCSGSEVCQELVDHITHLHDYMKESTAKWKIVYAHHPMYTQGRFHSGSAKRLRLQPMKDEAFLYHFGLEERLMDSGVDCYFAGHEHVFQYHHVNGIHNICCGASGADIRPGTGLLSGRAQGESLDWVGRAEDIGFVVVEITSLTIRIRFINVSGQIIKEVNILK